MVFVKVRETYDLHTTTNKMTVIGIHTPKPDIIKKNYPGLLVQCKMYRPVSCDVKIACASVMPLDPLGVGTSEGAVSPEDVFNPILYKAMSNKGMSQLEARINAFLHTGADVDGDSAMVDTSSFVSGADDFNLYYGLLSNTNEWRHANPQSGLEMKGLKPLVYEILYNVGDSGGDVTMYGPHYMAPDANGVKASMAAYGILGRAKEFPFIPCTDYSLDDSKEATGIAQTGFVDSPVSSETNVPFMNVYCGCIIVPPSRNHELFYRMVVEWTIEFSSIRPVGEITDWIALSAIGSGTHYQNYSYAKAKEAITGNSDSILEDDSCMVSANVDVKKVM